MGYFTVIAVKIEGKLVELHKMRELSGMVKKHRKMAGLTQNGLADLAGVGKTLVYDIEKGHEKVSFDKLLAVLRVLNIKVQLVPPKLGGK